MALFREGSVLGAAEAASIQTTVSVAFRPLNSDGWPRLTGTLTKSYSGSRSGSSSDILNLPGAAVGMHVEDTATNEVLLLAATGDDASPYSRRSFMCSQG